MAPPGSGEDASAESRGSPARDSSGTSRDVRRLLIGVLFMAALAGVSLAAVFLMGRPAPGTHVAPGVPVLAVSGMGLIVGAAVVFYRTYRGQ